MSHRSDPAPAPFTAPERDLLRRELCQHFGEDPRIADGIFLRTWRGGERRGQPKIPLALLVNGQSASASEIVAGALKNLDRAVIVGSRTFGKGSVQVLYDNDDGSALKLTAARDVEADAEHSATDARAAAATQAVGVEKPLLRHRRSSFLARG